MPALTSITAKVMILLDAVLSKFVTVTSAPAVLSNCDINVISGTITPCGQQIVDALDSLIYMLVKLGSDFLPALGPLV